MSDTSSTDPSTPAPSAATTTPAVTPATTPSAAAPDADTTDWRPKRYGYNQSTGAFDFPPDDAA